MHIHHLNCGTLAPGGGQFVCNVLLLETAAGLVLIDTGFGLGDIRNPDRLGAAFLQNARPKLDESETAIRQIEALGYSAGSVRHIVMTHLDRDHAGGLNDFPDATVHLHEDEFRCAIENTPGVREGRYVREQWRQTTGWRPFPASSGSWFGLPAARPLEDIPELVVVPLPGHTPGHCGIAIETDGGWLLHAGDTHYHHWQRRLPPQSPSPVLDMFQKSADSDTPTRERSQNAVGRLAVEHPEIDVICTHDPHDLHRFAAS